MFRTLLLSAAVSILSATASLSLTLNFDGTDPAATASTSSGYIWKRDYEELTFQTTMANFNGYWIWGNITQGGGNLNYSGTWDGRAFPLIIKPGTNGASDFDLSAIRVKNTSSVASGISITGYKLGGGSVTQNLSSGSSFVDLTFGEDWKDLRQVNVNSWFTGGATGVTTLVIDSLSVNELAPVPLPAAGLLMLAGLGGLAAVGRRRVRS